MGRKLRFLCLNSVPTILVGILLCACVLQLLLQWYHLDGNIWSHLKGHLIWGAAANSLIVGLCTAILSLVIGVCAAWTVAFTSIPGKRTLSWLLATPLVFPPYTLGYIFVGLFDYGGLFSDLTQLAFNTRFDLGFRSIPGLIFTLSLALSPYSYLLMLQAFKSINSDIIDAAKAQGATSWHCFFHFVLPQSKPWLISSAALVFLESIADFGTVSIFSVTTLTLAIYKSWYGFYSIETAAQIASLLCFLAAFIFIIKKASDSRQRYANHGAKTQAASIKTVAFISIPLGIVCYSIVAFALFLPLMQLCLWLVESPTQGWRQYINPIINTSFLGIIVASAAAIYTLQASLVRRFNPKRWLDGLLDFNLIGYGIPGAVFAVAVYLTASEISTLIDNFVKYFNQSGHGLNLNMTIVPLVIGLLLKFLALIFSAVSAAFLRIPKSQDEVAFSLGASRVKTGLFIILPQIKGACLAGFLLVLLEVFKEMPLTLMTRPLGWDTLSVKIFEFTSEGDWDLAAAPALILVALGCLSSLIVYKVSNNDSTNKSKR